MATTLVSWDSCMKQAGDSPNLAKGLLELLLEKLPEFKDKIQTILDNEHWDALEKEAHKITGASGYCGITELRETAHQLELALQSKDIEKAKRLANQCLQQLNQAGKEIDELLKSGVEGC